VISHLCDIVCDIVYDIVCDIAFHAISHVISHGNKGSAVRYRIDFVAYFGAISYVQKRYRTWQQGVQRNPCDIACDIQYDIADFSVKSMRYRLVLCIIYTISHTICCYDIVCDIYTDIVYDILILNGI